MDSNDGLSGIAARIKNIDGKTNCSILKSSADVQATDSDAQSDLNKSDVPVITSLPPMARFSYADTLKTNQQPKKVNFRFMECEASQPGVDVVLPKESVRSIQNKLQFTLYGYFLGDRIAYPVVEYFVKTNWKKYGLQKSMMNSNGFFFFKFDNEKGMLDVLEGGPWLIRSKPIFLNIWSASSKLKKEDIKSLAVWVKLHDVPLAAYTEEGLSMLASKIGKPKVLDSYTTSMCLDVWGRSSYARALIEVSALQDLKTELTISIPQLDCDQYEKDTIQVEYEWSPPKCSHCTVFGHDTGECLKNIKLKQKEQVVDEDEVFVPVKRKKSTKRGGFTMNKQPAKVEYRPIGVKKNKEIKHPSTKNKASSSKGFTQNSFADLSFLNDDDTLSDDEEVIEGLNDTQKFMASGTNSSSKGASTPFSKSFYGKL